MVTFALDDLEMDGQLQRTVAAAYSGSADIGEAMAAARRVVPGDDASWHAQWSALARKSYEVGEASERGGHPVSAARAYLRGTEYWRQAIFFIRRDLDDPRLQQGWRAHRQAFRRALPLLPWVTTIAEIPLGAASMTAYLMRPPGVVRPRRTVLAPCGFDSTAEAGYSATATMALTRGYNVLLWDGPGQGGMLYEHRVPMRPDFEAVVAPVIDWLLTQQGIDPDALALVGRSMGGYLAPRAATVERRLAALVCDPGQVEFVSRIVPKMFSQAQWERVLAADPATERQLQRLLDDPHKREYFGARMTTMGAATVGDFLRLQPAYSIEDTAKSIRCPTLLTEGEGDFATQSGWLFDLLTCDKHLHRFSAAEGAGGHCCGLGATLWEGVAFDWLDQVLPGRA